MNATFPPDGWIVQEFRFPWDGAHPLPKLRAWLDDNIEGRYVIRLKGSRVRIAFENDCDAMTFRPADGATEAFKPFTARVSDARAAWLLCARRMLLCRATRPRLYGTLHFVRV
jgi:hypothetical protein